jgi:hypothetical protein
MLGQPGWAALYILRRKYIILVAYNMIKTNSYFTYSRPKLSFLVIYNKINE